MRTGLVISLLLPFICSVSFAQQESTGSRSHSLQTESADSLPRPITIVLPPQLFIPKDRMEGLQPWLYAPITRPTVIYMPVTGFNGGEGFGQYFQEHPDKFFSNFLGRNVINLPNLYVTRQMMIGNTLRLDKKGRVYLLSGILYQRGNTHSYKRYVEHSDMESALSVGDGIFSCCSPGCIR